MVSLASLPEEIWSDVVNLLSNLREIVRLDCAFSGTTLVHSLRASYEGKAFRFPIDAYDTSSDVLNGVHSWMQDRRVYINHLSCVNNSRPLPPQWVEIIPALSETLHSLSFQTLFNTPSLDITWLSKHFLQLRTLHLCSIGHQKPEEIERLLQSNARTLESLKMEGNYLQYCHWYPESSHYPKLQVLHWACGGCSNLCGFLATCPNLTALHVAHRAESSVMIEAIAQNCPLLRRLCIEAVRRIGEDALQELARGCPLLVYLSLSGCSDAVTDNMVVSAVQMLPSLHTLQLNELGAKSALLKIAAQGHPSLRIVDVFAYFKYDVFQEFTEAMSQLTGLGIVDIDYDLKSAVIDMFQHCRNLQHLRFGYHYMPAAAVNIMLDSVAVHCPNLRTLSIETCASYDTAKLCAVIEKCRYLSRLRIKREIEFAVPANRRNLLVAHEFIQLEEWMQEGSN